MASDRFFAFVEAEDRLKNRRRRRLSRGVSDQRVVQTVPDGALVCAMQHATLTQTRELAQLRLDPADILRGPLLDNRCVETTELRDVKKRPRPFRRRWGDDRR